MLKSSHEKLLKWPSGTCDIPQLEAHSLLVQVEHFEGKVDTDGGSVVWAKVVMHIALDDAGLAHAQVSYNQDFVEVFFGMVVLHGGRGGRGPSMNPLEWKRPRDEEVRRRVGSELVRKRGGELGMIQFLCVCVLGGAGNELLGRNNLVTDTEGWPGWFHGPQHMKTEKCSSHGSLNPHCVLLYR